MVTVPTFELLPGWAGSNTSLGHWGSRAGSTHSYKLFGRAEGPGGHGDTWKVALTGQQIVHAVAQHPAGLQSLVPLADLI